MATMPNLVGLNYQAAIVALIKADIIPNEGLVPTQSNPPATIGIFSPWPIDILWVKGDPVWEVTKQVPASGDPVTVSYTLNAKNGYTPPITLTVNAPPLGVNDLYTAGAYS